MKRLAIVGALLAAACGGGLDVATQQQAATACGPGTHLEGSTCVLDATRFELRVARKLGATPLRNRIVVFGTKPDGSPEHGAELMFSVEPASAGTFTRAKVTLAALGAETYFVPCDVKRPECTLGPATIRAALASDPATPIVQVGVAIVDPIEASPAKACLTGGSVVHLEGNDAMLNGTLTVTDAAWTFPPIVGYPNLWQATAAPPGQTDTWSFQFNTASIAGAFVVGKVYDRNLQRATFALSDQLPGRPAMYVARSGVSCATISGSFEIVDYKPAQAIATFVFEQHCNGDLSTALTGCVHYEQP